MHEPFDIIKKVRLTEKATLLSEKENKYVFEVAPSANKTQIKSAVQTLMKKKVIAVNTANYAGKLRRQKRADQGRTNNWKKAIVTLAPGEKIDFA